MSLQPALRVSNPPSRAVLIWDGDCRFCALWVERWRQYSQGRIDDATFQQAAAQFPDIPRTEFERAIVLIDSDGKVFTAAEAIFRSLRFRAWQRVFLSIYEKFPPFAAASEFFYGLTARHRRFSSAVTGILWGKNVCFPTYFRTQRWFLRGLGLVYLTAFVSYWTQIDGLIGSDGILPIADFLGLARDRVGPHAPCIFPTLCWLDSSNRFLHLLCGSGVVLSVALIIGIMPVICLLLLFIFYLSLAVAGQTFFHFQWDILLLETGFLALFFAPLGVWLNGRPRPNVPRLGLLLLKLLLFKLMLMSGVVKLTSGDDCWWNLTALDYHYWSQPLPTAFAWFADKHPEWFKKFSVVLCLVVEIVVPFFMWAPRRLRLLAAGLLIALQIVIAITGNYCFFNLLTIVLCLLLIDDTVWSRWSRPTEKKGALRFGLPVKVQLGATVFVLAVTLPLNGWHIYSAFAPDTDIPRWIATEDQYLQPFRICSGYGLFRVMTKDRREIVIEGSRDGIEWTPYEFKWKPGDLNRVPGWCAPHQPRVDWQMWFAALSSAQQNPWFLQFVERLLQNKAAVTRLLAANPFPKDGPVYIRARCYRYRFTSREERARTGAWWRREELAEYLPTVSMR